jgi:acylphosphatase
VALTTILVRYSGMVQGVGFRATVRRLAQAYDLKGWVKNEGDGGVTMVVHGSGGQVEAFLKDIRESRLGPMIDREVLEPQSGPMTLEAFGIRH